MTTTILLNGETREGCVAEVDVTKQYFAYLRDTGYRVKIAVPQFPEYWLLFLAHEAPERHELENEVVWRINQAELIGFAHRDQSRAE